MYGYLFTSQLQFLIFNALSIIACDMESKLRKKLLQTTTQFNMGLGCDCRGDPFQSNTKLFNSSWGGRGGWKLSDQADASLLWESPACVSPGASQLPAREGRSGFSFSFFFFNQSSSSY